MALLTLLDAQLAFGHVPLLDHADFALEAGERVGLIGAVENPHTLAGAAYWAAATTTATRSRRRRGISPHIDHAA